MLVSLNSENFGEYVNSDVPTIVDFYAEWCGPCQRMLKILPRLQEELGDTATIGKVNADDESELREAHGIRVVPTFFVYKNGLIVEKWEGIKTLEEMKGIIQRYAQVTI